MAKDAKRRNVDARSQLAADREAGWPTLYEEAALYGIAATSSRRINAYDIGGPKGDVNVICAIEADLREFIAYAKRADRRHIAVHTGRVHGNRICLMIESIDRVVSVYGNRKRVAYAGHSARDRPDGSDVTVRRFRKDQHAVGAIGNDDVARAIDGDAIGIYQFRVRAGDRLPRCDVTVRSGSEDVNRWRLTGKRVASAAVCDVERAARVNCDSEDTRDAGVAAAERNRGLDVSTRARRKTGNRIIILIRRIDRAIRCDGEDDRTVQASARTFDRERLWECVVRSERKRVDRIGRRSEKKELRGR